jgi:D-amino-acid dehydrogenase
LRIHSRHAEIGRMQILIIGAGIVGLTTAWSLTQDGHAVTVIDQHQGVGEGTSLANGAQLSYSYVAPMAAPGVLASLPKWLLSNDSPVRYVPSADPGQLAWLLRFLAACTDATSAANTAKLLRLSSHSRDRLHALIAETGIAFDHRRNGKLVIQSTDATQDAAEAQMRLQAAMGCVQQALSPQDCIALEPGLESVAHRLRGGILTPGEEVGDCHALCLGLHQTLLARGAVFQLGAAAHLATSSGRIAGVDTAKGRLTADLYVLAAGTGSLGLGREVRLSLPVRPIRGYSISAPVLASNRAPVRSITDTARKTVYAPLGDRLRVAGFAEIGGSDTHHLPARASSLSRELDAIFPGACAATDLRPWAGLRPATPTGVPIIGRSPLSNLLLNVGHGALGFTLACGSAQLLADLIAGRHPAVTASDYAT